MTTKTDKKFMLVVISAVILTLAVFSTTLSQNTFALQIEDTTNAQIVLNQKLTDAHDLLTKKIIDKGLVEKLEQEKVNPINAEIPLVLSYVDPVTSTLVVGIDSDGKLDQVTYEKKLKALVGDVPMQIIAGKFVREACSSQSSTCRPLWGGIKVEAPDNNDVGTGPQAGGLTLNAQTLSGKVGFIMSGHVVGSGIINVNIGQPSISSVVGTVKINPSLTNRVSDSAFVERSTGILTESKIYKAPNTAYTVTSKITSSNTPVGTTVKMMSIAVGEVTGTIQAKGVTVADQTGTLTNQIKVNYSSYLGDSGSPVYSTGASSVSFYGIHVGKFVCVNTPWPCASAPEITVYSPWESIKGELTLI